MDVAVDDAGHNEFAAKVHGLAFIIRETGLITHIDEFTILTARAEAAGFFLSAVKILAFLMMMSAFISASS